MAKTSPHMDAAINAIQAQGGTATPTGGGYWAGADGRQLAHAPVPGTTSAALGLMEGVSTSTIYTLERRGILKRTGKDRRRHRDTYILDENAARSS